MNKYTDLELKQINDLCLVIKDKHQEKFKINDIDDITDKMVHSLHYDNRVNSIYGKKSVTIGALKQIFIHGNVNNKVNHTNETIIDNYEKDIDHKLNRMEYNKKKEEQKKCCRSCIIC
jgi:hypothetical protein